MSWLDNLNSAINYIEQNLEGEISYDEAAKIACCSTNYFQRMFSYVADISLAEYIRCRKMTQAAFDLQTGKYKIIDVAMKYGYNSPTSFNRAFQAVHGVTPVLARKQGCKLNAYSPIRLTVQVSGGKSMAFKIEEKDLIRVVGVRIALSGNMEEDQIKVPVFWKQVIKDKTIKVLSSLSNQDIESLLGITLYQDNGQMYYYIGVATDKQVPENMYECEIKNSTWVVFESTGLYKESVQNIFKNFLTQWLPFSGYKHSEVADIEVYPLESNSIEGYSQVWISVKKE